MKRDALCAYNCDCIDGLIPCFSAERRLRELRIETEPHSEPLLGDFRKEPVIPASTSTMPCAMCIKRSSGNKNHAGSGVSGRNGSFRFRV